MRAIARFLLTALVGLALVAQAQAAGKSKVLIIDGQNNHNWKATTPVLKAMLEKSGAFEVEVCTTPPNGAPADAWAAFRPQFKNFQAVLVNYNDYFKGAGKGDQWPEEVRKALEQYMQDGGGLVIFHAANNAFPTWVEWNKMIALNWQGNTFGEGIKIEDGKVVHIPVGQGPGAGHGPQHEYDAQLLNKEHPITKGMPATWHHTKDELYHGQRGPAQNMDVLVYGFDDPAATKGAGTNQNEPLVYTVSYGKGRVFVNLMGHDAPQTEQPDMIALMTRGTEWAATGKVTLPLPENFKAK